MDYYDEVLEIKNKNTTAIPNNETVSYQREDDEVKTIDRLEDISRPGNKPVTGSRKPAHEHADGITSESESETESEDIAKYTAEGFDYKQWEKLEVPSDIRDLFQYISRYSAPKIDITYTLQPFIPDFIPAVGDIDAFLKVTAPQLFKTDKSKIPEFIEKLGLEILDEPCGEQSEPALLHMKLRSISTTNPHAPGPPPSVSKSTKDVEKWIAEVQALRANQPYPMVAQNSGPDIDALMTEWPTKMEQTLNNVGFPSANLKCSLKFYIELVCGLFDIPLALNNEQTDYILSLNTLFNLYMAVKNPIE